MGIERLDYFLSAVRCKSFTKAALECGVVPSTISQQIASLEKEIGFPLFSRKGRGVSLTRQGELFYQKAQDLQAEYRSAVLQTKMAKRLQMGVHSEQVLHKLPAVLHRGIEELRQSGVEIVIERYLPHAAREKMRNGECDLYVGFDCEKWTGFCKKIFSQETVGIFTPQGTDAVDSWTQLVERKATIYASTGLWESLGVLCSSVGERGVQLHLIDHPDMVIPTAKANGKRAIVLANQTDCLPLYLDKGQNPLRVFQALFWNKEEQKETLRNFFENIEK